MIEVDPKVIEQLLSEGAVSVTEAIRKLPTANGVRRPETMTRWIVQGKHGVQLEGFSGPDKTWWTSWPALARFFAALTAQRLGKQLPPVPQEPSQAMKELLAMGRKKRRA
jgi:hypothetical protein